MDDETLSALRGFDDIWARVSGTAEGGAPSPGALSDAAARQRELLCALAARCPRSAARLRAMAAAEAAAVCRLRAEHFLRTGENHCPAEACAVIKNTQFEGCDLHYASLDRARLTAAVLLRCDLSEASLTELRLRSLCVRECRFVKTCFFKTALAGVDFSSCELTGPVVSSPPAELKGAVIAPEQAAGLIGLLGVRVKR